MKYMGNVRRVSCLMVIGLLFLASRHYVLADYCTYNSTQSRVQADVSQPWSSAITIGLNGYFNVGGFHDGTGQFSDDTMLIVTGPNSYWGLFHNGDRVYARDPGVYTLTVTTPNQNGGGCQDNSTVAVGGYVAPSLTPTMGWYPSYRPQPTVRRYNRNRDGLVLALVRWILGNSSDSRIDQMLSIVGIN